AILLIVYFFRAIISRRYLELVRKLLIIAPLIFFFLAVSSIFNVFDMNDYVNKGYEVPAIKQNREVLGDSLTTDTRTFLYLEVLHSAQNHNSWWIGRSPARGNDTEAFAESSIEQYGRAERVSNEVAILNIFTWTGIIGVLFYLFVFYKASYLAINQSNNIFSKMIGLFIAFRWAYAWVEDINNFTLNYFMLWLMIGFCFSNSFRKMNDVEMKRWIRGIFDRKYVLSNFL
ncbi:MAG: hypothetical protein ACYC25_08555, partial [Paludibacter sp.]